MAGTTSISGLSSGLDTASIIDQLMTLEAAGQTKLKSSLTTQQSTLKYLQDLNSRIASLATQASDLGKPAAWNSLKATSSSTAVTATASAVATAGSYSVTVDAVATSARATYGTAPAGSPVATPGTVLQLATGGDTVDVDTGDGTMSALVTGLNATGKVRATTITLDNGDQRLVITSRATGQSSDVALSDPNQPGTEPLTMGAPAVTAGTDAAITIGGDTVHSATNTFSGVLTGVTLTVTAAAVGTTAQLEVASDPGTLVNQVKSMVDAVNSALSSIDSLSGYNSTTKTAGPLAGDAAARSLRSALLETVYPPDGTSLASVGLQTDRTGKLVFDADAFATAYAADPAGVAATFNGGGVAGFSSRVKAVATTASDPYTGTLTTAITGRSSTIQRTQDDIAQWDIRLELKRTTLQRQFTALETALNQMNSQSSWLASQINALSSSSTS